MLDWAYLFVTRSALALSGLAAFFSSGCRGDGVRIFRDTEGREFSARCEQKRGCALEQKAGPPAPEAKTDLVVRSPGRIFTVCNAPAGAEPDSPADCRPLVCGSAAECPPVQGLDHGECLNAHCIEPSHAIGAADAIVLCLAGTGLGRESARQVERYALALNCGSPCKIPSPCAEP